jgi:hypothetical protein
VLGLGTTAGIVVQTVGLIPALRRVGFRWKWRLDFRKLGLRELGRLSVWMLLFVVVSQLGVLVVLKIAKAVGSDDSAGPDDLPERVPDVHDGARHRRCVGAHRADAPVVRGRGRQPAERSDRPAQQRLRW